MTSRLLAAIVFLCAGACVPRAARADAPLGFWPAAGSSIRFHVTRVSQTADGQRPATTDIVIRRKTETTGTLERTLPGGERDLTVLAFTTDGRIAPSDPAGTKRDPDLANLVDGLNFAASLLGGATASGQAGWSAMLAPPPPPPTNTIMPATLPTAVPLPVRIVRTDGIEYDFDGRAQSTVTPTTPQRTMGSDRRERRGFPGGGGFPGAGYPRRVRDDGAAEGAGSMTASPVTITTHLAGHASHGALTRLAIDQSRSVSIDGLVYVNASGWTFETARDPR